MKRNLIYISLFVGITSILSACNTVEGTVRGATEDVNSVASSVSRATAPTSTTQVHNNQPRQQAKAVTTHSGSKSSSTSVSTGANSAAKSSTSGNASTSSMGSGDSSGSSSSTAY